MKEWYEGRAAGYGHAAKIAKESVDLVERLGLDPKEQLEWLSETLAKLATLEKEQVSV